MLDNGDVKILKMKRASLVNCEIVIYTAYSTHDQIVHYTHAKCMQTKFVLQLLILSHFSTVFIRDEINSAFALDEMKDAAGKFLLFFNHTCLVLDSDF